jgi:SAM-dependent methyltransferase
MGALEHWQEVHGKRAPEALTWYQPVPTASLALIEGSGCGPDEALIDVGAGSSRLIDHLLARGFRDLTALDLAPAALEQLRRRLGSQADAVRWRAEDLLAARPDQQVALWHDRAVFHFLTDAADRARYRQQLLAFVRPGGHVVIGTFAEDGPERCSGLPVVRYSQAALAQEFAPEFERVSSQREEHVSPGGLVQPFSFVLLRRAP